jgi:hypothetical protein
MLAGVRTFLNKSPWIGWVFAGLLLCASIFFYFRSRSAGADPYSPQRMTEMVTIRFTDDDSEITMPRGRLDKQLRQSGDHLDPTIGITNPKTGKPTGFLVAKDDWDAMIARINKEKEEAKKNPSGAFAPASSGKK